MPGRRTSDRGSVLQRRGAWQHPRHEVPLGPQLVPDLHQPLVFSPEPPDRALAPLQLLLQLRQLPLCRSTGLRQSRLGLRLKPAGLLLQPQALFPQLLYLFLQLLRLARRARKLLHLGRHRRDGRREALPLRLQLGDCRAKLPVLRFRRGSPAGGGAVPVPVPPAAAIAAVEVEVLRLAPRLTVGLTRRGGARACPLGVVGRGRHGGDRRRRQELRRGVVLKVSRWRMVPEPSHRVFQCGFRLGRAQGARWLLPRDWLRPPDPLSCPPELLLQEVGLRLHFLQRGLCIVPLPRESSNQRLRRGLLRLLPLLFPLLRLQLRLQEAAAGLLFSGLRRCELLPVPSDVSPPLFDGLPETLRLVPERGQLRVLCPNLFLRFPHHALDHSDEPRR
mmetsp:Transcript_26918/g.63893  ORF Transcript_26918/g.63893 Transcript_26918/m.63893 type:complete len:390 (-) Transcript_26918:1504-2673(-)